jgi:hypothetical protein
MRRATGGAATTNTRAGDKEFARRVKVEEALRRVSSFSVANKADTGRIENERSGKSANG